MTELMQIVNDVTNALVEVDATGVPFRSFAPGVGPYGEPQLLKLLRDYLCLHTDYGGKAVTKRTPDLLIPSQWALEFKIVRPFGDNGIEAENWTVNLLHPYPGSKSSIGDCLKLLSYLGPERRAVFVIGFEHNPAKINLSPLINAFEVIADKVAGINLGSRIEIRRDGLIHPVHQRVRVFAWEISSRST